jgi:hypothetical protein
VSAEEAERRAAVGSCESCKREGVAGREWDRERSEEREEAERCLTDEEAERRDCRECCTECVRRCAVEESEEASDAALAAAEAEAEVEVEGEEEAAETCCLVSSACR